MFVQADQEPSPQSVVVSSDAGVRAARLACQELAAALGFSRFDITCLATATSELARNIWQHAGLGIITFDAVHRHGAIGIRITARDEGPGIPDIEQAMQTGFSTVGALGLGLPGAARLVDEFAIDASAGRGTTVTVVKWLVNDSKRRF
jgi:serine/threonine-protein kinase RsbT